MITPAADGTGDSATGFPECLVARLGTAALAGSSAGACRILGLAGPPGSGKTTLARQWREWLRRRGRIGVILSLDDFYLSRDRRRHLAQTIHPWLARRGVPGTHDLAALDATLEGLQRGAAVSWPRFDKTRDDVAGIRQHAGGRPDAVLVEGWCLACRPLARERRRPETWRRHVNAAILAMRSTVERHFRHLFLLRAPEPGCIPAWRHEQELARPVPLRRPNRRRINAFVAPMMPLIRDQVRNPPASVETIALDHLRRPLAP